MLLYIKIVNISRYATPQSSIWKTATIILFKCFRYDIISIRKLSHNFEEGYHDGIRNYNKKAALRAI